MKKNTLQSLVIIILLSVSLNLSSQSSLLVTNITSSTTINNNAVITKNISANNSDLISLNIQNTSSSSKTYKLKKSFNSRNIVSPGDSSYAHFVFANVCHAASVNTSATILTLNSNQSAIASGYTTGLYFDEASIIGISSVTYRLYDIANPTVDFMEFTINYNSTASIKNNSANTLTNSGIFPNPSNLTTSLHFDSKVYDENAKLTILNVIGEIIMSQKADVVLGENRINIQTASFTSGTYYAYIVAGSNIIERKFVVSK